MRVNLLLKCAACEKHLSTLLDVDTAIMPEELHGIFKRAADRHRAECIFYGYGLKDEKEEK